MSDPVLAEITVVPGTVDYAAPSAYVSGTLFVYINGILVQQDGDEAVDEGGGNLFSLREPLRDGDTLHVYYQESGPTFRPFPTPPRGLWALDLVPISGAAINLVPKGVESEDLDGEPHTPSGNFALDLVPQTGAAFDLVPRPISAEEI